MVDRSDRVVAALRTTEAMLRDMALVGAADACEAGVSEIERLWEIVGDRAVDALELLDGSAAGGTQ